MFRVLRAAEFFAANEETRRLVVQSNQERKPILENYRFCKVADFRSLCIFFSATSVTLWLVQSFKRSQGSLAYAFCDSIRGMPYHVRLQGCDLAIHRGGLISRGRLECDATRGEQCLWRGRRHGAERTRQRAAPA